MQKFNAEARRTWRSRRPQPKRSTPEIVSNTSRTARRNIWSWFRLSENACTGEIGIGHTGADAGVIQMGRIGPLIPTAGYLHGWVRRIWIADQTTMTNTSVTLATIVPTTITLTSAVLASVVLVPPAMMLYPDCSGRCYPRRRCGMSGNCRPSAQVNRSESAFRGMDRFGAERRQHHRKDE